MFLEFFSILIYTGAAVSLLSLLENVRGIGVAPDNRELTYKTHFNCVKADVTRLDEWRDIAAPVRANWGGWLYNEGMELRPVLCYSIPVEALIRVPDPPCFMLQK